jgi:hypothetical protein
MDVNICSDEYFHDRNHGAQQYNPIGAETARQRKRREWQEAKIEKIRSKNRGIVEGKQLDSTTSAILDEHVEPQYPGAKPSSSRDQVGSSPDRSPSQWKTIRELKLCARCLTRTIPPHKPGFEGAPCEGQPYEPWNASGIERIRRASMRLAGRTRDTIDESSQAESVYSGSTLYQELVIDGPPFWDAKQLSDDPLIVRSPQYVDHEGASPVRMKRFAESNRDLGGMDPPSPLTTGINIWEDFGPRGRIPLGNILRGSNMSNVRKTTHGTVFRLVVPGACQRMAIGTMKPRSQKSCQV